jgi:hypothetical protein
MKSKWMIYRELELITDVELNVTTKPSRTSLWLDKVWKFLIKFFTQAHELKLYQVTGKAGKKLLVYLRSKDGTVNLLRL